MLSEAECKTLLQHLQKHVRSICGHFECYLESSQRLEVHFNKRMTRVVPTVTHGISFSMTEKNRTRQILRNDLDTGALGQSLGVTLPPLASLSHLASSFESSEELVNLIARLKKSAGEKSVQYSENTRSYAFFDSDGHFGLGEEESAHVNAGAIRRVSANISSFRQSLGGYLETINESPRNVLWPVPGGKQQIIWTPRALSELLRPFFRSFESEMALKGESLLSNMAFPQPFLFSLIENGKPGCDHEGTPIGELPLFVDGRPRSLACNRATSDAMEVSSTGHSRKHSYSAHPVIGFWNLHLQGFNACPLSELYLAMPQGIEVSTALFNESLDSICVLRARLVHEGGPGEFLEPFQISISIPDFLISLQSFSKETLTIGMEIQAKEIMTDCTLPWALSSPLQTSGKGSTSYW